MPQWYEVKTSKAAMCRRGLLHDILAATTSARHIILTLETRLNFSVCIVVPTIFLHMAFEAYPPSFGSQESFNYFPTWLGWNFEISLLITSHRTCGNSSVNTLSGLASSISLSASVNKTACPAAAGAGRAKQSLWHA